MELVWQISIGQVITLPILAGILYWLWKLSAMLRGFLVEHEMLMGDLADRNGKQLSDFPTRRAKKEWP